MIGTMQITTLGARASLSLVICLLAMTACVYEIPIQQGNFLDATALVQVKKGMTRAQVRYLLGTPIVPGGFDNDRWDYDYYLKLRQFKRPRKARATVYFRNDLVDHVDSDVMPVASDVADTAPATAPTGLPASAPVVIGTPDQNATAPDAATTPAAAPAGSQPATSPDTSIMPPAGAPASAPPITPSTAPIVVPASPAPVAPATAPSSPPSS
jgi:outer membrane protein assembly factor BamE